jgi:hypothetical protein
MKKRSRKGLKRRYGHTARRGLYRSLKTVEQFIEHADDLRNMAQIALRRADEQWRTPSNKAALRKTASRHFAEAQRADHEVMRLGGAP